MNRRRLAATAALLVGLQGALVLGYRAFRRSPESTRFTVEKLGETATPPLPIEDHLGRPRELANGRPVLVHFWATWCAPCRRELPTLIALGRSLSERYGLELLAVSVDDDWKILERYFAGDVPPEIHRSTELGAQRRWGTDALPDTYLVDASGRLRARYRGARDWNTDAARQELERTLPAATIQVAPRTR